ncbi:uncharacterized protein B0I36DRAFT_326788 [Microdochium trichocladiopsis]|uniref:Uncharacterized protein n=1 Tax=Microdochium trichocladiopsis TaxID=1682393 RepID=A0A9P8Y1Q6_9PEZI|nr:uncharacterized protein B0I36DRAFT_326788 [Microdochium trichocladiopsis]KAH7027274.1 hypothetical protein B0I36DRAFT_326788 [Microdochium trichocladiopsis]
MDRSARSHWVRIPLRVPVLPASDPTQHLDGFRSSRGIGPPLGTQAPLPSSPSPSSPPEHDRETNNGTSGGGNNSTTSSTIHSFQRLPNEIIALIISFVLQDTAPPGRVFHFSNYASGGQRHRDPVGFHNIAQFTPRRMGPTVCISRYARVCRAWRDLVYAHFYGSPRNGFHFRICGAGQDRGGGGVGVDGGGSGGGAWLRWYHADSRGDVLTNLDEVRDGLEKGGTQRWLQVLSREQTARLMEQRNALGVLTSHTARWVRRATLSVFVRRTQTRADNDHLLELVDKAVDLLGGERTGLRDLQVQLHYDGGYQCQMSYTLRLVPTTVERPDDRRWWLGLEDGQEDAQLENGVEALELDTIELTKVGCYEAPLHSTTARILNPLLRLRGVHKFGVGGLVTGDFSKQLTEAVMESSPV